VSADVVGQEVPGAKANGLPPRDIRAPQGFALKIQPPPGVGVLWVTRQPVDQIGTNASAWVDVWSEGKERWTSDQDPPHRSSHFVVEGGRGREGFAPELVLCPGRAAVGAPPPRGPPPAPQARPLRRRGGPPPG